MQEPSLAIFFGEIVALIVVGRLVGELMERIGQPAVMGQLIGGMLLGPSVFGALLPGLQHALFPSAAGQKAMLDAVSQLGILLLLLLTGMETDLSVIRSCRRTAFTVSFAGIAIPFACGVLLGEWLPAALLPDPNKRLITALFLGTALSISSVKIVALLVRELGFLRRTVGQVIVASAIIDDTVGWIIMSVIFGLALHGGIDIMSVTRSVLGTGLFLVLSFTIGRRIVFFLIRWANDRFVSELPVITMIIVITGLMALATDAVGVHTVLGSFVAGILVGQSPILTRHIEDQLRGLIVALFMPVFFGMAGLSANLLALSSMSLLMLTIGLIVIASIGKFSGAFLGGRLDGRHHRLVRPVDGRVESESVHVDRHHGDRDDDGDAADVALGRGPSARPARRKGADRPRRPGGARLPIPARAAARRGGLQRQRAIDLTPRWVGRGSPADSYDGVAFRLCDRAGASRDRGAGAAYRDRCDGGRRIEW